jgi:SOS-response transcriptional repressor LexA
MDNSAIRKANLAVVLDNLKMTQAEFAELIDTSASYLSQIKKGVRPNGDAQNIGNKLARKIEEAAKMPFGWMDENHSHSVQSTVLRYDLSNVMPIKKIVRPIPVISSVAAGQWREAIEEPVSEYVYPTKMRSQNAFGLLIIGKSMEPDFKEDEYIIVDPDVMPNPTDYVVALNGKNEATFKKYRSRGINENGEEVFELIPLNPDFATIRSDREKVILIGTVVDHLRSFRK